MRTFYLSVCIAVFAAVAAAAHAELNVVALGAFTDATLAGGDPAPDGNGVFWSLGIPTINNSGELAFTAVFNGTAAGNTDRYAVVRGGAAPGSLRVIVRSGAPAPDGNGNFAPLVGTIPVINDAGQVAFYNRFSGTFGGADNAGILRSASDSDTLTMPARDGDHVDGVQVGLQSLRLAGIPEFAMNDAGQVAFGAVQGIFLDSTSAPIALVQQPGPGGNGMFFNFSRPALNDGGQVAFGANLGTGQALFRGSSASLEPIVRQGDPAPGAGGTVTADSGTFIVLSPPAINNSGAVAFYALLSGVTGPANQGLFRSADTIVPLAHRGDLVPRGGSILDFRSFYIPLTDSGQTAFSAVLTGTSGGMSNNIGMFRTAGNGLTEIARKGDPTPDGGGTFFDFDRQAAINTAGQVAFRATIDGSVNMRGIFLYDDEHGLRQVVRQGQCLGGKTIADVQFAPYAPDNSMTRTGLNDQGQVGFLFDLQDGRRGVALWTASEGSGVVGDCNADGAVTIDELLSGVNIALGFAQLSTCPSFDANHDGEVSIDELIRAVDLALNGCA